MHSLYLAQLLDDSRAIISNELGLELNINQEKKKILLQQNKLMLEFLQNSVPFSFATSDVVWITTKSNIKAHKGKKEKELLDLSHIFHRKGWNDEMRLPSSDFYYDSWPLRETGYSILSTKLTFIKQMKLHKNVLGETYLSQEE